jgi:hypothetical protein
MLPDALMKKKEEKKRKREKEKKRRSEEAKKRRREEHKRRLCGKHCGTYSTTPPLYQSSASDTLAHR